MALFIAHSNAQSRKRFKVIDGLWTNFTEANQQCDRLGMQLAWPQTGNEQDQLDALLNERQINSAWLGAIREGHSVVLMAGLNKNVDYKNSVAVIEVKDATGFYVTSSANVTADHNVVCEYNSSHEPVSGRHEDINVFTDNISKTVNKLIKAVKRLKSRQEVDYVVFSLNISSLIHEIERKIVDQRPIAVNKHLANEEDEHTTIYLLIAVCLVISLINLGCVTYQIYQNQNQNLFTQRPVVPRRQPEVVYTQIRFDK